MRVLVWLSLQQGLARRLHPDRLHEEGRLLAAPRERGREQRRQGSQDRAATRRLYGGLEEADADRRSASRARCARPQAQKLAVVGAAAGAGAAAVVERWSGDDRVGAAVG